MPIASKPECVDGPRQQLTTRRLRECLLPANPSGRWPTPKTHNKTEIGGMTIASKPECVDGPRQQLTTRRRLRECLLPANPSVLMAHANNSQQDGD